MGDNQEGSVPDKTSKNLQWGSVSNIYTRYSTHLPELCPSICSLINNHTTYTGDGERLDALESLPTVPLPSPLPPKSLPTHLLLWLQPRTRLKVRTSTLPISPFYQCLRLRDPEFRLQTSYVVAQVPGVSGFFPLLVSWYWTLPVTRRLRSCLLDPHPHKILLLKVNGLKLTTETFSFLRSSLASEKVEEKGLRRYSHKEGM